jgi:hypothetical protein
LGACSQPAWSCFSCTSSSRERTWISFPISAGSAQIKVCHSRFYTYHKYKCYMQILPSRLAINIYLMPREMCAFPRFYFRFKLIANREVKTAQP